MNIWLERLFLILIFSLGSMQPGVNISGLRVTPTDLLFVLTVAAFGIVWIAEQRRFTFDPVFKYVVPFALAMLLSAVHSVQPGLSVMKLAGVFYLIGLTILTINVVGSEKLLKVSIKVWIAASTLVCLVGVITVALFYIDRTSPWHSLFLHHYGSLPVGNYPRIQSTFVYPAMLCNYLTVAILMILAAIKLGWIKMYFGVTVLAMHGIAALFTLTPGLGGLIFSVATWFGLSLIRNKQYFLGRTILFAGAAAFVAFLAASAFSIWPIATSPFTFDFFGTRIDPSQRLLAWRDSVRTFLEHPVFGKGIGLGVAGVRFQAPSGQMQFLTDAHNTFLSVAAQAGILGLIALISLIVSVIRRGSQLLDTSTELRTVRTALVLAFVSGFILQGFVGSFEDARHLWVLIGLIIVASRIEKTPA